MLAFSLSSHFSDVTSCRMVNNYRWFKGTIIMETSVSVYQSTLVMIPEEEWRLLSVTTKSVLGICLKMSFFWERKSLGALCTTEVISWTIYIFFCTNLQRRAFSISNFGQETTVTNSFVDLLIRFRQNYKLNQNLFLPFRPPPIQNSIIFPLSDAVTSETLTEA